MPRYVPLRSPTLLAALLIVPVLALALPGCGDDAGKDRATTPYGTSGQPGAGYAGGYAAGAGGAATGIPAELQKKVDAAIAKGRELLLSVQGEGGGFGDVSRRSLSLLDSQVQYSPPEHF